MELSFISGTRILTGMTLKRFAEREDVRTLAETIGVDVNILISAVIDRIIIKHGVNVITDIRGRPAVHDEIRAEQAAFREMICKEDDWENGPPEDQEPESETSGYLPGPQDSNVCVSEEPCDSSDCNTCGGTA